MVSKTIRIALVIACIVVAWSLGRAQTTVADFEISIDALQFLVRSQHLGHTPRLSRTAFGSVGGITIENF